VALFRWDSSCNYLWNLVDMTPKSNNDTTGSRLLEDWLLSLMSTLVMGFGPQDL
jgi:hypothetical protein